MKPLMTIVNRPMVASINGNDMTVTIGLTTALIIEKMRPAIRKMPILPSKSCRLL